MQSRPLTAEELKLLNEVVESKNIAADGRAQATLTFLLDDPTKIGLLTTICAAIVRECKHSDESFKHIAERIFAKLTTPEKQSAFFANLGLFKDIAPLAIARRLFSNPLSPQVVRMLGEIGNGFDTYTCRTFFHLVKDARNKAPSTDSDMVLQTVIDFIIRDCKANTVPSSRYDLLHEAAVEMASMSNLDPQICAKALLFAIKEIPAAELKRIDIIRNLIRANASYHSESTNSFVEAINLQHYEVMAEMVKVVVDQQSRLDHIADGIVYAIMSDQKNPAMVINTVFENLPFQSKAILIDHIKTKMRGQQPRHQSWIKDLNHVYFSRNDEFSVKKLFEACNISIDAQIEHVKSMMPTTVRSENRLKIADICLEYIIEQKQSPSPVQILSLTGPFYKEPDRQDWHFADKIASELKKKMGNKEQKEEAVPPLDGAWAELLLAAVSNQKYDIAQKLITANVSLDRWNNGAKKSILHYIVETQDGGHNLIGEMHKTPAGIKNLVAGVLNLLGSQFQERTGVVISKILEGIASVEWQGVEFHAELKTAFLNSANASLVEKAVREHFCDTDQHVLNLLTMHGVLFQPMVSMLIDESRKASTQNKHKYFEILLQQQLTEQHVADMVKIATQDASVAPQLIGMLASSNIKGNERSFGDALVYVCDTSSIQNLNLITQLIQKNASIRYSNSSGKSAMSCLASSLNQGRISQAVPLLLQNASMGDIAAGVAKILASTTSDTTFVHIELVINKIDAFLKSKSPLDQNGFYTALRTELAGNLTDEIFTRFQQSSSHGSILQMLIKCGVSINVQIDAIAKKSNTDDVPHSHLKRLLEQKLDSTTQLPSLILTVIKRNDFTPNLVKTLGESEYVNGNENLFSNLLYYAVTQRIEDTVRKLLFDHNVPLTHSSVNPSSKKNEYTLHKMLDINFDMSSMLTTSAGKINDRSINNLVKGVATLLKDDEARDYCLIVNNIHNAIEKIADPNLKNGVTTQFYAELKNELTPAQANEAFEKHFADDNWDVLSMLMKHGVSVDSIIRACDKTSQLDEKHRRKNKSLFVYFNELLSEPYVSIITPAQLEQMIKIAFEAKRLDLLEKIIIKKPSGHEALYGKILPQALNANATNALMHKLIEGAHGHLDCVLEDKAEIGGNTALHLAVKQKNYDLAFKLVNAGANSALVNEKQETAANIARKENAYFEAAYLDSTSELRVSLDAQKAYCCNNGSDRFNINDLQALYKEFVEFSDINFQSLLNTATRGGDVKPLVAWFVSFFICARTPQLRGNEMKETVPAQNLGEKISQLIERNRFHLSKIELAEVVNWKHPHINDDTVLHQAVKNGDLKAVVMLLSAGADPTIANRFGETPLFLAMQTQQLTIQKLLRDKSAAIMPEVMRQGEKVYEENLRKSEDSIKKITFDALKQGDSTNLDKAIKHCAEKGAWDCWIIMNACGYMLSKEPLAQITYKQALEMELEKKMSTQNKMLMGADDKARLNHLRVFLLSHLDWLVELQSFDPNKNYHPFRKLLQCLNEVRDHENAANDWLDDRILVMQNIEKTLRSGMQNIMMDQMKMTLEEFNHQQKLFENPVSARPLEAASPPLPSLEEPSKQKMEEKKEEEGLKESVRCVISDGEKNNSQAIKQIARLYYKRATSGYIEAISSFNIKRMLPLVSEKPERTLLTLAVAMSQSPFDTTAEENVNFRFFIKNFSSKGNKELESIKNFYLHHCRISQELKKYYEVSDPYLLMFVTQQHLAKLAQELPGKYSSLQMGPLADIEKMFLEGLKSLMEKGGYSKQECEAYLIAKRAEAARLVNTKFVKEDVLDFSFPKPKAQLQQEMMRTEQQQPKAPPSYYPDIKDTGDTSSCSDDSSDSEVARLWALQAQAVFQASPASAPPAVTLRRATQTIILQGAGSGEPLLAPPLSSVSPQCLAALEERKQEVVLHSSPQMGNSSGGLNLSSQALPRTPQTSAVQVSSSTSTLFSSSAQTRAAASVSSAQALSPAASSGEVKSEGRQQQGSANQTPQALVVNPK